MAENEDQKNDSDMSVSEAGRMGGERTRDLVSEGKEAETSESDDESQV
jgi:hypothetical protein